MINIIASSRYLLPRKQIKKFGDELIEQAGYNDKYVLNIVFVGKIKMREISLKYKKEDEALPVLSFSYLQKGSPTDLLIGEIFICYPQLVLLAAERQKKVDKVLFDLIYHGFENIVQ